MLGLILLIFSINLYSNKKYYISIILFFLFLTNGFQVIPVNLLLAGLPLDKGTDLALIYIFVLVIWRLNYIKAIIKLFPLYGYIVYFVFFILLDALYSFFVLEYSIINVIQVFREYLIFFCFVPLFFVPIAELKRVFHFLAIVTVLQSFLYLLQIFTKSFFLNSISGNDKIVTNLEGAYIRFYNSPALLIVTTFYFLFFFNKKKRFYYISIICILVLAIIGPLHRANILAIFFSLSYYLIIKKGKSIHIFALSFVILIGTYVDIVSDRMNKAYVDLTNSFTQNISLTNIDQSENTFLFRIAHFWERLDYILKNQNGWLFGIGLISENSKNAKTLPFTNGLVSEITGQVVQVDTGDLIYSPLILTTGVVGTIFYLFIFIKFLRYFSLNLDKSRFAIIGFLVLLNAFLISMSGTEMLSFTFRVSIILISTIVFKQSIVNRKNQI